jgi:hypothetical protein
LPTAGRCAADRFETDGIFAAVETCASEPYATDEASAIPDATATMGCCVTWRCSGVDSVAIDGDPAFDACAAGACLAGDVVFAGGMFCVTDGFRWRCMTAPPLATVLYMHTV